MWLYEWCFFIVPLWKINWFGVNLNLFASYPLFWGHNHQMTLENNPSFYFAYMLLSMVPEHIMFMDSLYIVSETNSASWGSQSLCPLVSPQALYFGRWLFLWCWSMLCLLSLWERIPLYLGHNHFTLLFQPKLWFLEGDYFCYAAASILYEIADYLLRTGTHF